MDGGSRKQKRVVIWVLSVKGPSNNSSVDEIIRFVTRVSRPAVENVLWHRCVYLDAMVITLQRYLSGPYISPLPTIGIIGLCIGELLHWKICLLLKGKSSPDLP